MVCEFNLFISPVLFSLYSAHYMVRVFFGLQNEEVTGGYRMLCRVITNDVSDYINLMVRK
jgi:hypothetical protein